MTSQPNEKAIDLSDIPELDSAWFSKAEFTKPGQRTFKIKLDSAVLEWYQKYFPSYRSSISRVLSEYKQKNIQPAITNDRIMESVELTWKFDPDVILWLKESKPTLANQILKDFMQSCKDQNIQVPQD